MPLGIKSLFLCAIAGGAQAFKAGGGCEMILSIMQRQDTRFYYLV
jgi:hypothetical protein